MGRCPGRKEETKERERGRKEGKYGRIIDKTWKKKKKRKGMDETKGNQSKIRIRKCSRKIKTANYRQKATITKM